MRACVCACGVSMNSLYTLLVIKYFNVWAKGRTSDLERRGKLHETDVWCVSVRESERKSEKRDTK